MTDAISKLTKKLEGWGEQLILMLPNLLAAVLILSVFWILGSLAGRTSKNLLARVSDHRALIDLISRLVKLLVRIGGFVIALQVLELDKAAGTFLAGAGIIGLALGFAFQDITANFIAGVAMAIKRPLQIGDLVETNGYLGHVEAIEMRATRLKTLQGQRVIIPNRKVFEECLVNFNVYESRRVDIAIGVSYGDDLEKAQELATNAVASIPDLKLEREPEAFFKEFGDSSINFDLRFWVPFKKQTDFLGPQSLAIIAVKRAFSKGGITIPFPIRTLDFGIVGGEKLSSQLPSQGGGEKDAA